MSTPVDFVALRKRLQDAQYVAQYPFDVLRSLCHFVNNSNGTQSQELVLRGLEVRHSFGNYAAILDGLVRHQGLFPYLDPDELSFSDRLALEAHRPPGLGDSVVFHRPQAEVYWTILEGKSVVLSAPTSFGKSLIIDALVASGQFRNVLIVVPTIALIDETRRRLSTRFRSTYKILTHQSQRRGERNVLIGTQERVLDPGVIDDLALDLFVVDEFYKLSPARADDARAALLNQVVYRLLKRVKRFYMLGPNVLGVSNQLGHTTNYEVRIETYQTVVTELIHVPPVGDPLDRLVKLCSQLSEPTIVFTRSPARATEVAKRLLDTNIAKVHRRLLNAADWIAAHYHAEWHVPIALSRGIGVHHGRVPRALAQFVVHAFNDELVRLLVCTSTLIEGVNTKAKNIVILDNQINRAPLDLFTFNNIRGRSGRMGQHFIGRVYLFHSPPEEELPFVDVPVFEQDEDTPESLLIQIDDEDLTTESRERIGYLSEQKWLSVATIRASVGIDPDAQVRVAAELARSLVTAHRAYAWRGMPSSAQLRVVADLIWRHFNGGRLAAGSVRTAKQLWYLINRLRTAPTMRDLIRENLRYSADPDQAVQESADFVRLWASFHFPRLLRAVGRIQREVFGRSGLVPGDYEFFASRVESLFVDPALVALEEYGVPLELARTLEGALSAKGDLDGTLDRLRGLDVARLQLHPFEVDVLRDAQEHI